MVSITAGDKSVRARSVSVLLTDGEDHIELVLDVPSAHPEMKYAVSATIKASHGYGVEWVRQVFGVEPSVTDVQALRGACAAKIG